MTLSHRFRRWPLLFVAAVVILVGVGVCLWYVFKPSGLPGRGTETYKRYVRAFQVGTAALEAGSDDIATKNLDEAIALIPAEPAAWANRGLFHLRHNSLTEAARDLKHARELAPENGKIEALLGLLADKQGRFSEAVAHFHNSLEREPHNPAALFTLAQIISKEKKADSDAQYQRLMDRILKDDPNNLRVLVEKANTAWRRKDKDAFRSALQRMAQLAPEWSSNTREQLHEVRKAAEHAPHDVLGLLNTLGNLLRSEQDYKRGAKAIKLDPGQVGTPLHHFLKLERLPHIPSPPDPALTFSMEPLAVAGNKKIRWDVARPVWFLNENNRKELATTAGARAAEDRYIGTLKPVIFLANATDVKHANAEKSTITFAGGEKNVAPKLPGLLAVDLDNDFRFDLVLTGTGGMRFWQQKSDGTFANVTEKTKVSAKVLNSDYYGTWPADIEMDGDLDVIAGRRSSSPVLLRNNRDGTFKTIELFSSVKGARDFVWADFNSDGAPDAAFLDAAGNLHVFANEYSAQFKIWALPEDVGTFLALSVADINDDGAFDLIALRSDGMLVRFSDQGKEKPWYVADVAPWPGAAKSLKPGDVKLFAQDLDNNGALDIIVGGPQEAHVFLANEKNEFVPLPKAVSMHVHAVLDLNRDGKLDFVGVSAKWEPVQALNQGTKNYHWQTIWPLANTHPGDHRINSFGIGGEAEILSGELVQKQPITGPVLHFGLGEHEVASVARIVWPNGDAQPEFDLPGEKVIVAVQRIKGSCPFLFTHNGKEIQFVADFMWNTPLGMYINAQTTGPNPQTTEWLKIRGDQLAPRNGYYDVRIHANLHEADYFDQLALIVVDHPPGTEVHVDERFFLEPTPPIMHVTTPAKPVARAWDHHGKDATDEVRKIDGWYLDRVGRGRFQGVSNDHWVEAELGDDMSAKGPVWLIARGWLHPTNSSINTALAQGNHDMPRPLVLEVPDGKGGWKVGRPALGFPAGKNKTMLIRLDGIEGKGVVSKRFRLRTNMEIFWDFLGYARGLDPKLAKLQRPAMLSADLRYRGILQMTQKNRSSPEVPIYENVMRGVQPWRDLKGFYTRFGDVRELVAKVDDRYVIMNAGDEIAFRFAVPKAPTAGWVRDFIWESDGWTRDGDPNTRFGRTVLPLPAHNLKEFNGPPGWLEDDPVYRRFPDDWRNYHTRYITPDYFAQGLRTLRRPSQGR